MKSFSVITNGTGECVDAGNVRRVSEVLFPCFRASLVAQMVKCLSAPLVPLLFSQFLGKITILN